MALCLKKTTYPRGVIYSIAWVLSFLEGPTVHSYVDGDIFQVWICHQNLKQEALLGGLLNA